MPIIRLALLYALLGLLPVAANSQPAAAQAEWIDALRQGEHVIVFRHGATYQIRPTPILSIRRTSPSSASLTTTAARSQNRLASRCTNSGFRWRRFKPACSNGRSTPAHCWASAVLQPR